MPEEPNVVWIAMEDTTPRFGCYGDDLARTPRIDDLASESRVYQNAFTTAGVCAPSRASIMTGMYPPAIGAHHMRTRTHDREGLPDTYEAVPPHYVTAFTEYLRRAGYHCSLDSKTDYQFGEPATMWDEHGEGAGWWDRDGEEPFFAMFTNGVTHESGMWDPEEFEPWGNAVGSPETDPDAVRVPPYLPDTEPTRIAIARQYDNIAASDAWIGSLLDRLEKDGLAEETIVVLWSDHGEGLPRKKRWPYDSGTHVPLIVRIPDGVAAGNVGPTGGETTDELVSLVDLGPTTLSLTGVDVPVWMQGRPFLGGGGGDSREYVFSTRDRYDEEYDMIRSVRGDRFRYVRNYYTERPYVQWIPYRNRHPAMQELLRRDAESELTEAESRWFSDGRPPEELYDLDADPHETENLVDDPAYAEVLERLRGALDDWRDRTGDRDAAAESEVEMRDRIRPDGDQPKTATPRIIPNAPGNRGDDPVEGEATFEGPMTVSLYCGSQGASISYALDGGDWQLYDGPLRLDSGTAARVATKAIRYGHAESDVREATITVE
jgi:arylsulfatase A-like enzyme